MADSDLNIIKAVESLPSIQGLTPAKQRQERKRQQREGKRSAPQPDEEQAGEPAKERTAGPEDDPHSVDYCA